MPLAARKGYTTAEVLIASFLSAILSTVVAVTLVSTSRSTSETVENTRLQQEHRVLVDVLGQFLRSAKPLGVCPSNDDPCSTVVVEGEHPFVTVTPSSLTFFSYTNAASAESVAAGNGDNGFAPDLVKVTVGAASPGCDQSRYACFPLLIVLSCNSTVSMNSPARAQATCPEQSVANGSRDYASSTVRTALVNGLGNAQLVRTIYVNNSSPFAFFDENGVNLTSSCAAGCSDQDTGQSRNLAAIATIQVNNNDPDCSQTTESPSCRESAGLAPVDPVVIALPSRGFRD